MQHPVPRARSETLQSLRHVPQPIQHFRDTFGDVGSRVGAGATPRGFAQEPADEDPFPTHIAQGLTEPFELRVEAESFPRRLFPREA